MENLFSVENDPNRSEFLAKKLRSELRGWTQAIIDKKLANLLSIIKQFNANTGPDILGICEVENAAIVEKLASLMSSALGRTYLIKHVESADKMRYRHSFNLRFCIIYSRRFSVHLANYKTKCDKRFTADSS